jgi:hypothetical protein
MQTLESPDIGTDILPGRCPERLTLARQYEPPSEVIRRQPNGHAVTCDHSRPVMVHVPAQFAMNLDTIIELDVIQAICMHPGHIAVEFDQALC